MRATVTKREQRLIDLTKIVSYTKQELRLLQNLANGQDCNLWSDMFDFTSNKFTGIDVLDDEDVEYDIAHKELNFLQFMLLQRNYRRAFLFLTQVPLKRVPGYITDPRLKVFAEWRMVIQK